MTQRVLSPLVFALALASCVPSTNSNSTANQNAPDRPPPQTPKDDSVTVKVWNTDDPCKIDNHEFPCAQVGTYLVDTLKVPKTQLIVLDDEVVGRTDNQIRDMLAMLRSVGFAKVMAIGFTTAPPRMHGNPPNNSVAPPQPP
jgi:hypothetical protein